MKVKVFVGFIEHGVEESEIERKVNQWLESQSVEVVDIKFASNVIMPAPGAHNPMLRNQLTILVTYKEVEPRPDLAGMFTPGFGVKPGE